MFPISTKGSKSARQLALRVRCKKCGHQSIEPLVRFHGRYKIACRECGGVIDLKVKKNRVALENLAKLATKLDAMFAKPNKSA